MSVGELRPWHYADPYFQHPPRFEAFDPDDLFREADLVDLTTRFYDGLGLEIRDILKRSDLHAREGKCQHAFCTHIDRGGDVRVLCNISGTKRWATTMLHEFGHAVYDKYIGGDLPWLLREPPHILSTEAIAQMMGRHTEDGRWLREIARKPAAEVDRLLPALESFQRFDQLLFARWTLVVVYFEQAMYADPERDLDTLWWDLVEKFQEVPRPEGRKAPDWASKIHIATSPVYYQNYLLGECMASQMVHAVEALGHGGTYVSNPKAGRFLVESLFRQGGTSDWDETLRRATGEPLNTDYFVRQYAN
ncbi:MAG: M2 family metallopeptidase [Planctomycetes bacterium]|nr:M2 family metallopeptidase [Planctomycetota bacterium]